MMHWLANLIDAFRPADGPPPNRLVAFFHWCLTGAWPVLTLAALVSGIAGGLEVVSALVLGLVIDAATATDPSTMLQDNWPLLLTGAAFFLLARPLAFAASSAASTLVVAPGVNVLVLQRLNRHTLGQSVTFFDDDFAGRIAQKQMQTATAITNVVTEFVNVVAFALASLVGSLLLLITIDGRMAVALFIWLIGYFATIRWFLPRVRALSKDRAAARALVSGRVVDTITNIKTVKLFAHHAFEDRSALSAMEHYRQKAIGFGVISAGFRLSLMTVAGALPVILIGGTVWLWTQGGASPGDIAATGAVSIRIAQMTGWVSFVLMTIYSNLGEVEDGMITLSPAHGLTDRDAGHRPRARGHPVRRCRLRLWPRGGRRHRPDARRAAGRKAGHRRRVGRGQIHPRCPPVAALRRRGGARAARWPRPAQPDAGKPAPPDRDGHAGNRDVQPLGPRQHPLWPPRRQ